MAPRQSRDRLSLDRETVREMLHFVQHNTPELVVAQLQHEPLHLLVCDDQNVHLTDRHL